MNCELRCIVKEFARPHRLLAAERWACSGVDVGLAQAVEVMQARLRKELANEEKKAACVMYCNVAELFDRAGGS